MLEMTSLSWHAVGGFLAKSGMLTELVGQYSDIASPAGNKASHGRFSQGEEVSGTLGGEARSGSTVAEPFKMYCTKLPPTWPTRPIIYLTVVRLRQVLVGQRNAESEVPVCRGQRANMSCAACRSRF